MSTENGIAERFVGLVLKHRQWKRVRGLPAGEMEILFEIVSAAGFEPQQIVPGVLTGDYREGEDGEVVGYYPISELCPFTVIDQDGEEDYFATGWLDCAVRRVVFGKSRQGENREQLIEAIQAEIERSKPLEPIQLTREGGMLRECPPHSRQLAGLEHFVDHTRDGDELALCVGLHKYCGGEMNRHRATAKLDVLSCRKCRLFVLFPKEVRTYGELRQALAAKFASDAKPPAKQDFDDLGGYDPYGHQKSRALANLMRGGRGSL